MKKADVNAIFMGSEPTWGNPKTEMSLPRALSWYSNQYSPKDSKEYTLNYVKDIKEVHDTLSKIDEVYFKNLGFVCRIVEQGGSIPNPNWINEKIVELIKNYYPVTTQEQKPDKTIQDRIFDQSTAFINDIDNEIDKFVKTRSSNFNAHDYFKSNDVKAVHANQIKKYYEPTLFELLETQKGLDEQLVEAYSHLSKKDLSSFISLVKNIIDACSLNINISKVNRKPRKRNPTSINKKIESLKYKKNDAEYNIVSIKPIDIIGAKILVVFNTVYKKLGIYYSDTGFDVKGTTLQNFNENTSIQKIVRKPNDILPTILNGKKNDIKTVMKNIKTTENQLTGRINEDTLLLRIIK